LANLSKKLEDMMNMKQEKLRERYLDTYKAFTWLRENKDRFKGRVYEPMMLVMSVKDPRSAKFIENHIPLNDLRAFVFQKQEDMEIFLKELLYSCSPFNPVLLDRLAIFYDRYFFINLHPSSSVQDSIRDFIISWQDYSFSVCWRYGFYSFLRELIDAPEEVMSYLCHQYRLNEVPVGTEKTKAMIETVIRESQLRQFYTAEEKYIVKKSNYTNKTISSNSALRHPQFLTLTVDADERRQLEEQLKTIQQKMQTLDSQMKALSERQNVLDRRDNELRMQKKDLSELKGKKRQLEQKISTKQDSLKQMEQYAINLQQEEERTKAKIKAVNVQKVKLVSELMLLIKDCTKLSMEKVNLSLESTELNAQKSKLETDCREGSSQLKNMEKQYTELENRKISLMENCKALLKKAKDMCNLDPGQNAVPEELHSGFRKLPNTVDEIDALLHEERSRASCFTGLNASVVDEYTKRTQEIENLTKELEEKKTELDNYRQNISQGMDPVNERRVFEMVVRTACKGTTSQYFFITPKLLQNLTYADEMTVLCIHNGSHMLPPTKWNLKAFYRRRQRVQRMLAQ
ncbi:UNVERIFIED_CONTAM: hypothetical protein FKN15_002975, partial [Acipenser sinensis]